MPGWSASGRNSRWKQKSAENRSRIDPGDEETSFLYTRRNRQEDVLDLIDQIERGFDDIEHRIFQHG